MMDRVQTILRISSKEGIHLGKNYFVAKPDDHSIEYIENGKQKQFFQYSFLSITKFRFSEVSTDSTTPKQFIDDHMKHWIEELLQGVNQFLFVVGHGESEIKYLMKELQ